MLVTIKSALHLRSLGLKIMEIKHVLICTYLFTGFIHLQAEERMEEQFERCCNLGTSWASEGLRCEKFVGPVSSVPPLEQGLCLEAVDICCIKTYHDKSCETGKSKARKGLACAESTNVRIRQIDDYQRDCCEGCKLGILTGSLGQGCALKGFSFGKPWDPAFLECCHETISTTTVNSTEISLPSRSMNLSTVSAAKISSDSTSFTDASLFSSFSPDDAIPTPATDDICKLLKGLLCSHICVPTPGSYRCECPDGYVLLEDQKTCRTDKPINRCQSDNPCEHKCIDTGMAVKCQCNSGYTLASDEHSCVSSTTNQMTPTVSEETEQTPSAMRCPPGYRYNSTVRVCDDINECANETCPSGKCENTIGSYICREIITSPGLNWHEKSSGIDQETCPPGYQWDDQHQACEDIDECTELASVPCASETQFCINTQGSFACHKLLAPKACPAGFKFHITTQLCQDVDECSEDIHGCLPEVEVCRNTDGGYECDVQCKRGFVFNHSLGICVDIDECAEDKNPCLDNKQKCINGPGGYKCATPKQLSHKNEEIVHMKMNEITHEAIRRKENNLISSDDKSLPHGSVLPVSLRPCTPGYRFDGEKCIDINECTEGPGCREHERCSNRLGSYDCHPLCQTGWYFDRISRTCQDVNECLLGRHNCHQDVQYCQNTNGSFICKAMPSCSPGYHRAQNGSCVDIDECSDKLHNCSLQHHQYCVNNPGGFDCVTRFPDCEDGYKYSLISRSCEDIDECSDAIHSPCDQRLQEKCFNLKGSFRCERPIGTTDSYRRRPACPSGYRYDTLERRCQDIDECREKIDICGFEVCFNQPGGYSCARKPTPITHQPVSQDQLPTSGPMKCITGLRYIRNRGCTDIDECREVKDICTSNEECVNNVGSYVCNCRMGFRRDNLTQACVDINECQLENDCLPTQRCDNTLGSYNCVRFLPCGTGYTLNAATELCEDDDECTLGTHDCSDGYHCRNTLGSYRCDRNPRGYTWTTRLIPQPKPEHSPATTAITHMRTSITTPTIASRNVQEDNCPSGFQLGVNRQCIDIDECSLGPSNPCMRSSLQRCINTIGSYRCVSRVICGAGYTLDPTSDFHCIDKDECADGTHQCGPEQTCENRQGGYVCICPPGHTLGPHKDCIDIDECSIYSQNICGTTGRCENTVGSYRCICEEGFEKGSNDNGCDDIDECRRTPGLCQHQCVNVWGSYKCICQAGYTLNNDNRSCSDIDECQIYKSNNLCVGICDNTPGSYSCRCPDGYRLGEDRRTCQDIDECATDQVCRDSHEMCQNTRGGYRCNKIQCPHGYHQDQERKNRCIRSSRYCPQGDLACYQSPSHYSFNFITFVSFLPIPRTGQLELFTMRGTHLPGSIVRFSMALVDVRAPPSVTRATESCFALRRPSPSQAVLVLTRSLPGPQEIQLDLSMEIYHDSAFAGSAVAKLFIYVTQYEF